MYMGMTDAQIKSLQPRGARYLVSDGPGLSLDVLPSGVKSSMYCCYVRRKSSVRRPNFCLVGA
jgi:hypothetical protein